MTEYAAVNPSHPLVGMYLLYQYHGDFNTSPLITLGRVLDLLNGETLLVSVRGAVEIYNIKRMDGYKPKYTFADAPAEPAICSGAST